jgi:predicted dehydrogenase
MKVLIVGAGRMGLRHAKGALEANGVEQVCLVDVAEAALEKAVAQFSEQIAKGRLQLGKPDTLNGAYEVAIVASTAGKRLDTCERILAHGPSHIMLEKPLGQSYDDVKTLIDFFDHKKVKVSVNLNMRMYDFIKDLKHDLSTFPQFRGSFSINFNGGALGIGANGIHYLDLLLHLFEPADAEIVAGEIDPEIIPSGRGPEFGDFGGWASIRFQRDGATIGRSLLQLSATSTVFGGWDIIGTHGRIRINELEGQRIDILRNSQSNLPVNRYAADYLTPAVRTIQSPELSNLTQQWLEGLQNGKELLPGLRESLRSHRLMFDWLSKSKSHKNKFPIT